MTGHEQCRQALGSYLVGALDPAERATVEAHLAGCPSCREELASYAGIPGLMSRLTLDEADRKSTRLNSSHPQQSRMPSSA